MFFLILQFLIKETKNNYTFGINMFTLVYFLLLFNLIKFGLILALFYLLYQGKIRYILIKNYLLE